LVWWWKFLTYLYRADPVDLIERHLALVCAGLTVANLTLFWIYCPLIGPGSLEPGSAADLLQAYPPLAVVIGLAFLVVGRLHRSRYYLVGLAHFLLAALLPLCLEYAPLILGVFTALCMVAIALSHTALNRVRGQREREVFRLTR